MNSLRKFGGERYAWVEEDIFFGALPTLYAKGFLMKMVPGRDRYVPADIDEI